MKHLAAILLILALLHPVAATDYYAAPAGTGTTCSLALPCPLEYAIGLTSPVNDGDTLFLRGGRYWHINGFTSSLAGSAVSPITVKSYPGEWAWLDSSGSVHPTFGHPVGALWEEGSYTIYRDFEVTNTSTVSRVIPGFYVIPPRGTGINNYGNYSKFINLVIHDTEGGFGLQAPYDVGTGEPTGGLGTEVFGCIIFNSGFVDATRGHGHGLYIQSKARNAAERKRVLDVISVNNFATGMKAFGEQAFVIGVEFSGVMAANNGSPGAYLTSPAVVSGSYTGEIYQRESNLFVGTTQNPADDIIVTNTYLYHPESTGGGGFRMGHTADSSNGTITVTNNYIANGSSETTVEDWLSATISNNTFYASDSVGNPGDLFPGLAHAVLAAGQPSTSYTWNNNTYFDQAAQNSPGWKSFSFGGTRTFAEWKTATGFDAASTHTLGRPTGTQIFIRANAYEAGRAHIAIYNWGLTSTVAVNLSTTGLTNGQPYEIRNAFNFLGMRVMTGVYNSASPTINIPMTGLTVAPLMATDFTPASVAPEFGIFVVLPTPNAIPYNSGTTQVRSLGRVGFSGKTVLQ